MLRLFFQMIYFKRNEKQFQDKSKLTVNLQRYSEYSYAKRILPRREKANNKNTTEFARFINDLTPKWYVISERCITY